MAEPDSGRARELLASDPVLLTARLTLVEVRRNIARILSGSRADTMRAAFKRDISAFGIIELDQETCESAAALAEMTGVRSLDAIHLAAARRIGSGPIGFLTFDLRQAQTARGLGFTVLGA